jgi:hypothetical protein
VSKPSDNDKLVSITINSTQSYQSLPARESELLAMKTDLVSQVEYWRDRAYVLETRHKEEILKVIAEQSTKIAAQKGQSTKYRNENQALRDRIESLERQLSQALK